MDRIVQVAGSRCSTDVATGEGSHPSSRHESSTDSNLTEMEDKCKCRLDIIPVSHDWPAFESDMSEPSTQRADVDVGRFTRYKNLAMAIEAEEHVQRTGKPQPKVFGNKFQAATGIIMFFTVNLRLLDSTWGFLSAFFGYVPPVECNWSEDSKALDLFTIAFLIMDVLFLCFEVACVYRDRCLSTLRRKLRETRAYGELLLLHLYSFVVLGMCSGWQILRSYRQIKDPEYRDSFFAELNDPGMVNGNAFRMPLYSSHLTFLLELPFVCRMVHVFFRPSILVCDYPFCLATALCFYLVVVAVVTFDYSVSPSVREKYASSAASSFVWMHLLYRFNECLARFLTICAVMLTVVTDLTAVPLLAWAIDFSISTMVLCSVSKNISKRVLFLSVPFFGANLALFADEGGIAESSHRVTWALDVTRTLEWVLAVFCWYGETKRALISHIDSTYPYRLAIGLVLLMSSGTLCLGLRALSIIQSAKPGSPDSKGDVEQGAQQPREDVKDIFSDAPNDKLHFQSVEADKFAALLFSKGIGDQFASLLEIFWERPHDIRLSRLKMVSRLGEGGFGKVIKVQDTQSGRDYALKLQRKDHVATAAVREAEFLHGICHPFIVKLERVFCTSAFYGILLELCDCDLNRLILERERPNDVAEGLAKEEAKHLVACMVVALEHLHERRIIFRDLKPENVLTVTAASSSADSPRSHLGSRRDAKLADFGLAKHVALQTARVNADFQEGAATTSVMTVQPLTADVGTPAFMCPGHSRMDGAAGERSPRGTFQLLASQDWYALGCCLMLMLLGERGSRLVRSSEHREVLLPPPFGDIHKALRENSGHLGGDGHVLTLLLALTAESAAARAGAREIRGSPFTRDAFDLVDLVGSRRQSD
mmetsp:Transcript_129553/g.336060  ORF Transcript_129553/g.336060 Transcript_129553/m.336060 type:complete len:879 (-) Transcript_129553:188-2824(-)